MHLLGAVLSVIGVLASPQYNVAVQKPEGDVIDLGILNLVPKSSNSSAEFTATDQVIPTEGCIGLQTSEGFVCQTLYKDIPSENFSAIRAFIDQTGSVTQVQLTEGTRDQLFIEVPRIAPRPELKPARPAVNKVKHDSSKRSLHDTWKESKEQQNQYDDEEEEEKSFFEKYWIYMLPVGLVIFTNVMGRSAN